MKVYKFKVALDYNKKIYRHIEILGNQTLCEFHDIIYKAFDRDEEHLYSFYLTRKVTRSLRLRYKSPEYTISEELIFDSPFLKRERKYSASETKIKDMNLSVKDKLYYLFDFGDSWWHEITLLLISETNQTNGYPKIVKKVGESPAQYPDYDEEY